MKFRVTLEGRLVSTTGTIDDAARHALNVAMAELNKLGRGNAAIFLNSKTGAIKISCAVEADEVYEAIQPASDNIKLALGQGEIGSAGVPDVKDTRWHVEFIRSESEALVAA